MTTVRGKALIVLTKRDDFHGYLRHQKAPKWYRGKEKQDA